MTINTVKKFLLAGTALVAVSFVTTQAAHAAVVASTLDGTAGDDTWAGAGGGAAGTQDGKAKNARASDTVALAGHTLLITNNQTADDGSANKDTFALGAVTNNVAGAAVNITQDAASGAHAFGVTLASLVDTNPGTTTLTIANNSGVAQDTNVTVTGALTLGGNLALTNNDAGANQKAVTLTVGGAGTVTGTTTLTAGSVANASVTVTNNGANNTYTGAVTLNAGAVAGGDANLKLSGGAGTSTFTAGLTLNDGAAGNAVLTVNGTGAQTVAGTVNGAAAGEGTIVSNNAAGKVDFSNNLGGSAAATGLKALTLSGIGDGTNANEFHGTVRATTVTVGHASGQDTFDGTVTASNVNITAANTTGKGEYFKDNVTSAVNFVNADALVTLAAGKTITGAVDATVANKGTLTLEGAGEVTGIVGGTAALKVLNAGIGASVFDSAVTAQTINVTGTSTVDFKGAVTSTSGILYGAAGSVTLENGLTGGASFAGNDGTLIVSSGKSISGGVDATTTNKGTLTLSGGTQSVGAVGATQNLHQVNAGQSGGATTFTGAVKANTLSVGTGTVTLNAGGTGALSFGSDGTAHLAAGQTYTGSVDTAAANTGTFVFDGAGTVTTTFGAGHNLKTLTLSGAGVTDNVTGALVAAQTTNLGTNTLHTGSTYTLGASQTVNTSVTDDTHYGNITAGGAATVSASSTVNLTIASAFTQATAVGTHYDLALVDGTGGVGVGAVTFGGSGLWSFAQQGTAGAREDLTVRITRLALSSVANTPDNATVATALQTIGTTGDTPLDNLNTAINTATTSTAVNTLLAQSAPTVDSASQQGSMEIGAQVQTVTEEHVAALRNGESGVAAGVANNGTSMWLQGFGQHAKQDLHSSVAGYSADTFGGAVGVDSSNLISNGIVGVAFSYGNVNADSDNANTTKTSVDSYGLNLYGSTNLDQTTFLNGQVGYAYNDIGTTRHNVGGAGVQADGSTHANQYSAKVTLGRDYAVDYGTVLTPTVFADYAHLDTAGYTETGSGANLVVGDTNTSALNLGVGLKAAWKLKNADGSLLKPSVNVGYAYDTVGDRLSTSASFAGAAAATNPSFTTEGADVERSQFNAGAGLVYSTTDNWDLSANYNYTYKQDYDAHSGVLRVTSHF